MENVQTEIVKTENAITEKVKLRSPIKIGDKEIKEVELNFDKLTGNTLLNAEKLARAMGEQNPQIMFAQTYQMIVAAKASGVSYQKLCELPGRESQDILVRVNRFLFQ